MTKLRPVWIMSGMDRATTKTHRRATRSEPAPQFTLGWRLRLAAETAGVDLKDMARHLDVSQNTITRWTHDQTVPSWLVVREWAAVTGVSPEWLADRDIDLGTPDPTGGRQPATGTDRKATKTARTSHSYPEYAGLLQAAA